MSDRQVREDLMRAIESAVDAGWSPRQFHDEMADLWPVALHEKQDRDLRELTTRKP